MDEYTRRYYQQQDSLNLENALKHLCKEKGVSTYAIEKELGFPRTTLGRFSNPTISRVKMVAEYFGITVDDMINLETKLRLDQTE